MTTEISTNRATTGLALQTFEDAFRFSKLVANSEFSPKDFRGKPESCLLAIQHGAEVGLSPMQSLQSIAVINGRPCVWGDAALALVQSAAVCDFVYETVDGEGDSQTATCQAKRKGYERPTVSTFSVADAKRAGLWGKSGPWTQYPKRMLQLRARGFALRDAFPDVLRGLVTAEEARDYQPEKVVVRPKYDDAPTVVQLRPEATAVPEMTAVQKARLAVSRASTLEKCDALRKTVAERLADGTFSQQEADEIAGLLVTRAEMLIGSEVPA
jgi:hypothetical protein